MPVKRCLIVINLLHRTPLPTNFTETIPKSDFCALLSAEQRRGACVYAVHVAPGHIMRLINCNINGTLRCVTLSLVLSLSLGMLQRMRKSQRVRTQFSARTLCILRLLRAMQCRPQPRTTDCETLLIPPMGARGWPLILKLSTRFRGARVVVVVEESDKLLKISFVVIRCLRCGFRRVQVLSVAETLNYVCRPHRVYYVSSSSCVVMQLCNHKNTQRRKNGTKNVLRFRTACALRIQGYCDTLRSLTQTPFCN